MMDNLPAGLFVTCGILPAILYVGAGYYLWKRRIVLEREQWRTAEGLGYLFLAIYTIAGIWLTGRPEYAEFDRVFTALGWIAAPVLCSALGILVFASRQQLAEERWPSVRAMANRSVENRDSVRSAASGLSNDLNRALTALERARTGVGGEWWDTERGRLETIIERLRSCLKIVRGLDERYSSHLHRLAEAQRDEGFSRQPLTEEYEKKQTRLQHVQHDIDREFTRLLDTAVATREELDRITRGTLGQKG